MLICGFNIIPMSNQDIQVSKPINYINIIHLYFARTFWPQLFMFMCMLYVATRVYSSYFICMFHHHDCSHTASEQHIVTVTTRYGHPVSTCCHSCNRPAVHTPSQFVRQVRRDHDFSVHTFLGLLLCPAFLLQDEFESGKKKCCAGRVWEEFRSSSCRKRS